MAIAAITGLVPTPDSAARPLKNKSITFTVDVIDAEAARPKKVTLELRVASSNDLVFADGSKSFTQDETVGKNPVTVTFATKISGAATNLAFFRVTLFDDAENALMACLVRLE
jgi:hypothetical protein